MSSKKATAKAATPEAETIEPVAEANDATLQAWTKARDAARQIAYLDKIKLNPEYAALMKTVTDYLEGKS